LAATNSKVLVCGGNLALSKDHNKYTHIFFIPC
jgi:hypothetical protein